MAGPEGYRAPRRPWDRGSHSPATGRRTDGMVHRMIRLFVAPSLQARAHRMIRLFVAPSLQARATQRAP